MDFRYKLKKKWLAYWQKYKLKSQVKTAVKLFSIFILVWLIGSILTILSQWFFMHDCAHHPFCLKYAKYFWTVIIELTSGFDIIDDLHTVSKIISVIMLILGIIIFAVFTGQIVSMFMNVIQRSHHLPEKPPNFQFRRPIIICGINRKLEKIIEELRSNKLSENREIIIVDPEADNVKFEDSQNGKYNDVWYAKGNQADRKVLENVMGEKETSAIILTPPASPGQNNRYCDSRAIETAMAIEGYREKTNTLLELNDERNIPHLKHTKINEWLSVSEYGLRLVSQAALQHGMARVYYHLLGNKSKSGKSNQVSITHPPLPPQIRGLTYEEIRAKIIPSPHADITIIGFARKGTPGTQDYANMEPGNSQYIYQVNPVTATCRICGSVIRERDKLGRVRNACANCFNKPQGSNSQGKNKSYFPKDTPLTENDRLIYISHSDVDFNQLVKIFQEESQ